MVPAITPCVGEWFHPVNQSNAAHLQCHYSLKETAHEHHIMFDTEESRTAETFVHHVRK